MSSENKIIIAAAGSGKTTYLVKKALEVANENVLILTYTESNEAEIRKKIFDLNRFIPKNIFVMTWFSFLIRHGIRPFQGGYFDFDVRGMNLVNQRSGRKVSGVKNPIYWSEEYFENYYFDKRKRIFSDKMAKLVIRCDEKSNGSVFDRISRIFGHVFVDEVQDLAGFDLDILSRLFKSCSNVSLVGDPRQVIYQTHHAARHPTYQGVNFFNFFETKLPKNVRFTIDANSLNVSHRNSAEICKLSSKLYPGLKPTLPCGCVGCRKPNDFGEGLFVVRSDKHQKYLEKFQPVQLRLNITSKFVNPNYEALNFGLSKGLGFDHVIIYPTSDMAKWMLDQNIELAEITRAQFYVAITRARHSVAVFRDFKNNEIMDGFSIFE